MTEHDHKDLEDRIRNIERIIIAMLADPNSNRWVKNLVLEDWQAFMNRVPNGTFELEDEYP